MTDITPVVQALFVFVMAVVTTFLVPYLKTKVSAEKLSELKLVINVAVQAAEMLYQGSGRGPEKKEYVQKSIEQFLADHKMKVDMATIENMIESSVLDLNLIQEY